MWRLVGDQLVQRQEHPITLTWGISCCKTGYWMDKHRGIWWRSSTSAQLKKPAHSMQMLKELEVSLNCLISEHWYVEFQHVQIQGSKNTVVVVSCNVTGGFITSKYLATVCCRVYNCSTLYLEPWLIVPWFVRSKFWWTAKIIKAVYNRRGFSPVQQ